MVVAWCLVGTLSASAPSAASSHHHYTVERRNSHLTPPVCRHNHRLRALRDAPHALRDALANAKARADALLAELEYAAGARGIGIDLNDPHAWADGLDKTSGIQLARRTASLLTGVEVLAKPTAADAERVFASLRGGVWTSSSYPNGDARLRAHGYPPLVRLAMLKTKQSIEYTALDDRTMHFNYVAAGLARLKSVVLFGGAPLESEQFGEVIAIYTTISRDARLIEIKYGYQSVGARRRNEIAWKQFSVTSVSGGRSTTDEYTLARPRGGSGGKDAAEVVRSQSIYLAREREPSIL